jgi:hypothetical protein
VTGPSLLDWVARREQALTTSSVQAPERYRSLRVWMLARVGLSFGAATALAFYREGPAWLLPGFLWLAYSSIRGAMSPVAAAQAYQGGWVAGRSAMVAAIEESAACDLDATRCLQTELARDVVMLMAAQGTEDPSKTQ